jgi:hypothetical protein
MKFILMAWLMLGVHGSLMAQGADQDALLKIVAAAVNPDAEGDQKERLRKGLAALADLKAAGMEPDAAVQKAREQAQLGGDADRPSKMILEMWNLNTDRMTEPATLEALRAGKVPVPPLKRP